MNNFSEIQKAITLAEKMLKDCTDESKPVYLETIKQANEKLQKMLSEPEVHVTPEIKSEPKKKLDQHIRTIERTVASQPIFYGNNDKEAEEFIPVMEQLFYLLVTQVDSELEPDFMIHMKLIWIECFQPIADLFSAFKFI